MPRTSKFLPLALCRVQDCIIHDGQRNQQPWEDGRKDRGGMIQNRVLTACTLTTCRFQMCPAPQRVSFHIRYPFSLLQRPTSSSVTVSQTPREVWKGLFVPEVQFSAVGGNCIKVRQLWKGDPEPLDLSCWKLRRSQVSAQTLHGHRILVCSYANITLALKGDVFTSVFTP